MIRDVEWVVAANMPMFQPGDILHAGEEFVVVTGVDGNTLTVHRRAYPVPSDEPSWFDDLDVVVSDEIATLRSPLFERPRLGYEFPCHYFPVLESKGE